MRKYLLIILLIISSLLIAGTSFAQNGYYDQFKDDKEDITGKIIDIIVEGQHDHNMVFLVLDLKDTKDDCLVMVGESNKLEKAGIFFEKGKEITITKYLDKRKDKPGEGGPSLFGDDEYEIKLIAIEILWNGNYYNLEEISGFGRPHN